MRSPNWAACRLGTRLVLVAMLAVATLAGGTLWAGFVQAPAVGGISIDGSGVVSNPLVADQQQLLTFRETALEEIPGDLNQYTPLRKVSLRRLDEAIRKHSRTQPFPLPQEIIYLAGLQRIEYVFVYPEQRDIVIAGPAEGWQVDELGNLVGVTTQRPVLALDDLMVALRTARTTNGTGITCSIDPTDEGVQRLRGLMSQLQTIGNPAVTMQRIEEALGPQNVTVTGVPATTHFARVLVGADFRMKRLAMDFEPAPIRGLPSFLEMIDAAPRGGQNVMPRWWLAAKYDPIVTDGDGLAFRFTETRVECLTEDDAVAADGSRQATGRKNAMAQRWAELMTEKYDELAQEDSAFGQLRSIMDLAVVGALLQKEGLVEFANLEIPALMHEQQVVQFTAPRRVASKASFVKKGRNWIISASGGVKFAPWQMADELHEDDAVLEDRKQAENAADRWWWN
ncbi:MAG: DUF1598 domain-containing protein [Pirellulales bacterium]